jgi:hypothetical protein
MPIHWTQIHQQAAAYANSVVPYFDTYDSKEHLAWLAAFDSKHRELTILALKSQD